MVRWWIVKGVKNISRGGKGGQQIRHRDVKRKNNSCQLSPAGKKNRDRKKKEITFSEKRKRDEPDGMAGGDAR